MTLTLQTIKYITKDGVLRMVLEPSSTWWRSLTGLDQYVGLRAITQVS
jgi:hypothetical protein